MFVCCVCCVWSCRGLCASLCVIKKPRGIRGGHSPRWAAEPENSVALVRERTIPTERPPPVGEVSANFCKERGVTWSAQRVPTAVNLCFLDLEPLRGNNNNNNNNINNSNI
jgi:hypothetical protein